MPLSSVLGASTLIKPGVVTSSTRPSVPYAGQLIYETDTNRVLSYNGSSWTVLADSDTPPALELIKTATVTNAADTGTTWQSIFSSNYNSYRFVCHTLNAHTNGAAPRMTFFYSTNTEQTSTYYSGVTNAIYTGGNNAVVVNNGAYIQLGSATDNISMSSFSLDIHQTGSSGRGSVLIQYSDAYSGHFAAGGGYVATTRTYDGMKFFMSSGNISMTGSVYGYRK